jgi:hypothetical protein
LRPVTFSSPELGPLPQGSGLFCLQRTQSIMAFSLRNLSVLAYANGFTLWHYKAGDAALAAVHAPGFFAAAEDMLATGDMLMISAADGAGILCVAPSAGEMLRLA